MASARYGSYEIHAWEPRKRKGETVGVQNRQRTTVSHYRCTRIRKTTSPIQYRIRIVSAKRTNSILFLGQLDHVLSNTRAQHMCTNHFGCPAILTNPVLTCPLCCPAAQDQSLPTMSNQARLRRPHHNHILSR